MPLYVKRVYEAAHPDDGWRVLVDRLWPRGLSKERAKVDEWVRDCAPSEALRRWYAHDVAKWPAFKQKYFRELAAKAALLEPMRQRAKGGAVTLLFAASATERNNAVALQEYLTK